MLVGIKDHNTILDNHHHACGNGYCNTENKITNMIYHNSFDKNTRLVVLGGGESGVGAAILAKDLGMDASEV